MVIASIVTEALYSVIFTLGYQERTGNDERPEYLLVLSYSPLGCLQNFLKERTIDWSQLCKMSLSVAQGVAHLHTEIFKDGKKKYVF